MKHAIFFPAVLLSVLTCLPLAAQTDSPQAIALPEEPVAVPEWLFNTSDGTYPGISAPNPEAAEAREQAIGRALMLWAGATGQTLDFYLESQVSWSPDWSISREDSEELVRLSAREVRFTVLQEERLTSGETVVLLEVLPDGTAGAESCRFTFGRYTYQFSKKENGPVSRNSSVSLEWKMQHGETESWEKAEWQESKGGSTLKLIFNAVETPRSYSFRYAEAGTPYPYGTFGEGATAGTPVEIDLTRSKLQLDEFQSLGIAWEYNLLHLPYNTDQTNSKSITEMADPNSGNLNFSVSRSVQTTPCNPVKVRLAGIARQQLHLQIER